MAQFNAHFRNINGDDTYPLTDVIYRSKVDGSLLEVEHDRAALASKSVSITTRASARTKICCSECQVFCPRV